MSHHIGTRVPVMYRLWMDCQCSGVDIFIGCCIDTVQGIFFRQTAGKALAQNEEQIDTIFCYVQLRADLCYYHYVM